MAFKDISLLVLINALKSVITAVTPELKKSLIEFLDEMEEKAKQTLNPFDDCLVQFLKLLLL